ncbi:MAG: hypothetical protein WC717_06115, partial [Candidatus Micrarchaeia archaeon]
MPGVESSPPFKAKERAPLQEARALLACLRHRLSWQVDGGLPESRTKAEFEASLGACFSAIFAWRGILEKSGEASPDFLEAHISLGELFYRRGAICNVKYAMDVPDGASKEFWYLRAAESFETSIAFLAGAMMLAKDKDERK